MNVAAKRGNLYCIKFLVEKGANIHARNENALILSAQYGHLDVVKFLVAHGADIHAKMYREKTIKQYVIWGGIFYKLIFYQ